MFSGTAQVSHQFCHFFFVSSVCLLVRVITVDKKQGCRLLLDSLSELRSSVCERRLERTILSPALLPVKTAHFTQFFRQV
jgi:hypothetical protein